MLVDGQHREAVPKKSLISKLFGCFGKQNQVLDFNTVSSTGTQPTENSEVSEFLYGLTKYKFYMASNFYEDNIGRIEVVGKQTSDGPGEIVTTTF